jgi:hypothetical protein
MGGQDDDVGRGEQVEGVGPVTQEHEALAQTKLAVPGDQFVLQRPLPGGGEAHGQTPVNDEPGRVKEDVVPLLRSEVGDGHHQHGVLGNAELGAYVMSECLLMFQRRLGA